MSKQLKIVSYNRCLECTQYCEQGEEELQNCFFYNRKNVKIIDDIFNEELKDIIKQIILWNLDDTNCNLALTKSKDLSLTVEEIIKEIKNKLC